MKFDMPKDQTSIIKVIGVGGGGSNAVNHMYRQGIKGVDFIVCNTDNQALDLSPIPVKIQLGASLTEGMGAGAIPEVGKNAAIENIDDIKNFLEKNTKMVFITAGMGGGTGTGAAPVIAATAKEMGILTVGIVTYPFAFEGKKRKLQAEEGIKELRNSVDTLLVINNDRLREMYGNQSLTEAFSQADNVLTTAAKGIAEIITITGSINVDFRDVKTVMTDSGVAIMGSATAEGEERAIKAVQQALASPLLNDNSIEGARYVLLNITYGKKGVLMDEISQITDYIQDEAGMSADVIWGHGEDENLEDKISVTVIATGFQSKLDFSNKKAEEAKPSAAKIARLNDDIPTTLTKPIQQPETKKKEETDIPANKAPEPEQLPKQPFIKPAEKNTIPASQRTIEFEIGNNTEKKPASPAPAENEKKQSELSPYIKPAVSETKKEEPVEKKEHVETVVNKQSVLSPEEQQKKANERIAKLKELNMKLRAPSGLSDLENEPAYKRKQIKLGTIPHSSESEVSRFTLSEEETEDGEKKTGLRPNNPYIFDNVD
jgi:cell division protein FtsZ